MYLKEDNENKFHQKIIPFFTFMKNRKTLSIIIFALLVILSVTGFGIYCVYYGSKLHRDHYIQGYEQIFHYVTKSTIRIPINYIQGLFAPNPKYINISIAHMDFQKLSYQRELAFMRGSIIESDFIPAIISYKNEDFRAKINLAGRLNDNIASNKWSLRVKLKDDETLFNMREFNLLHPKIRYGIYEWVCHELEEYEGLISLRTDYIDVTINGKHKGIYFIEETFDKLLIENNKLREGIIFKPTCPLQIFQKNKVNASQIQKENLALLNELYNNFINGRLKASQLFDIKKMTKYYAITDLVNGFHQLITDNIHLYFNPVTGLIEPIGREWDVHFYRPANTICGEMKHEFIQGGIHKYLFADEEFIDEYINTLKRLTENQYLDDFFKGINKSLNEKLKVLYKEYPYYSFSKKYFYDNQAFIKKKLNPNQSIKAYYINSPNKRNEILIQNLISLSLDIISIQFNTVFDTITINPEKRYILQPQNEISTDKFINVNFLIPKTIDFDNVEKLRLIFSILGDDSLREVSILPWVFEDPVIADFDVIRTPSNIHQFDFLSVDEENKIIKFKAGEFIIDGNLIFPEGYTVMSGEGCKLDLINSAIILSYSTIRFIGTTDNPIEIQSSDSTGQGIVIINVDDESLFKNVVFLNLTNPSDKGWELTGAVTFYESSVSIINCQFRHSRSEDALNIIRSEFEIHNTVFIENLSDAFDADFSKGKIEYSSFINNGNDAIDISGCNVELVDIFIDKVGDKGISAGENSQIIIHGIEIINAELGITSKDNSEIIAENVILKHVKVGFIAFQKKPEFGPAFISVSGLQQNEIREKYLIEITSSLSIDGINIKPNKEDVKSILYGAEYGKSSK